MDKTQRFIATDSSVPHAKYKLRLLVMAALRDKDRVAGFTAKAIMPMHS